MGKLLSAICRGAMFAGLELLSAGVARAQAPQFIAYQGRLLAGTNLANGFMNMKFNLYTNENDILPVFQSTNVVLVSDGLYSTLIGQNVTLGSLTNALTNPEVFLEVVVNNTALTPREQINSVAYALHARAAMIAGGVSPNGITSAMIATGAVQAVNVANGAVGNGQLAANAVNASNIVGNSITPAQMNAATFSNMFWKLDGNAGTTPGTHFIGTPDNQKLVVKVSGQQVVRYEPTVDTPSIVGGYSGNSAGGLEGVTISGGGTVIATQPNIVTNNGHYGTIGGGYANKVYGYGAGVFAGSVNRALGDFSFVGDGQYNTALGNFSVIGGGQQNTVQTNSGNSLIVGGQNNTIQTNSSNNAIVGGQNNTIMESSQTSLIGAGSGNTIEDFTYGGFIGAGGNNMIRTNASQSVIGGGWYNIIQPYTSYSTIGGGAYNVVQAGQSYNFIGGGYSNSAGLGGRTTIGGGQENTANQAYSAVLGGLKNSAVGTHAIVGGGFGDYAYGRSSFIGGGSNNQAMADRAMIGGGAYNNIDSGSLGSAIAGGYQNSITINSTQSGIGGGNLNNIANSTESFLGGGYYMTITNSPRSAIAGGEHNSIVTADHSFIGGGQLNCISNSAWDSVIGGGSINNIQPNANYGFIGGGTQNSIMTNAIQGTIAGGQLNQIGVGASYSFIGGGYGNSTTGIYSSVPGGQYNVAGGANSFAAGNNARAIHDNSFVWNDGQAGPVTTTTNNQFLIHAAGGVGIGTTNTYTNLVINGSMGFTDNQTPEIFMYQTGNSYSGRMILAHSPAYPSYGLYYNDNVDQMVFQGDSLHPALSIGLYAGNVGVGVMSPTNKFQVGVNGAYCNGLTWTSVSDQNRKENFEPVNPDDVLARVAAMPVRKWNYKEESTEIKHIGPTAQDFHAAFGLGPNNTSITSIDEDGVALAAIQALNAQMQQQKSEMLQLKAENEQLKAQLGRLAQRMNAYNPK